MPNLAIKFRKIAQKYLSLKVLKLKFDAIMIKHFKENNKYTIEIFID